MMEVKKSAQHSLNDLITNQKDLSAYESATMGNNNSTTDDIFDSDVEMDEQVDQALEDELLADEEELMVGMKKIESKNDTQKDDENVVNGNGEKQIEKIKESSDKDDSAKYMHECEISVNAANNAESDEKIAKPLENAANTIELLTKDSEAQVITEETTIAEPDAAKDDAAVVEEEAGADNSAKKNLDTGFALDKLLSKINNIVDNCCEENKEEEEAVEKSELTEKTELEKETADKAAAIVVEAAVTEVIVGELNSENVAAATAEALPKQEQLVEASVESLTTIITIEDDDDMPSPVAPSLQKTSQVDAKAESAENVICEKAKTKCEVETADAKESPIQEETIENSTAVLNAVIETSQDRNEIVILDDDDDDNDSDAVAVVAAQESTKDKSAEQQAEETAAVAVAIVAQDSKSCAATSSNGAADIANASAANIDSKADDKSNKEVADLTFDNSDNASDVFVPKNAVEGNKNNKVAGAAFVASEQETNANTNSNCSSSSNLLEETQILLNEEEEDETSRSPENELEDENENDDDDDVVELDIDEEEQQQTEEKSNEAVDKQTEAAVEEQPDANRQDDEISQPAKRIRLSVEADDNAASAVNTESNVFDSSPTAEQKEAPIPANAESTTVAVKDAETKVSTAIAPKRTHEAIAANDEEALAATTTTIDDKEEISPMKKLKTDHAVKTEEPNVAKATEEVNENTNIVETTNAKKCFEMKSDMPKYPSPKLQAVDSEPIDLHFLKRFKKNINKMSRSDLEQLVWQKLIDVLLHKSEFAEMRELIESQEKLIVAHRTKISELSKQFRDLEMVNNRLMKDLEQKNSQTTIPVKITRAVGLQVVIPTKSNEGFPSYLSSSLSSATSAASSSSMSMPGSTQADNTLLPLRSANNRMQPPSAVAKVIAANVVNASRHNTPDILNTRSPATNMTSANAIRRGCVQKVTPTRSQDNSAVGSSSSIANVNHNVIPNYRNNAGISSTSSSNSGSNAVYNLNGIKAGKSVILQTKDCYSGVVSNSSAPSQAQAQQQQSTLLRNSQMIRSTNMPTNASRKIPAKQYGNTTITRQQSPQQTFMTQVPQSVAGGVSTLSITPAKPKEKAFIDLTDEEDMQTSMRQRMSAQQQSSNLATAVTRGVPPLSRLPANTANGNKANIGQRSMVSKSAAANTVGAASITRVQVSTSNPATQRLNYSQQHPAPLPTAPPNPYNAAWKLLPARPKIRISNLENGIVISWTMEEISDRFAECVSYQIYAYQETSSAPTIDSWRHVGDVKAMLLPMAVTLTQFQEGQRYHFAVRALDEHSRIGPFSEPKTWT